MLAFNSPTDRMMARVAIGIFTLGLLFGLYAVGPPLYWRFYATVIHPFEDPDAAPLKVDPFADMLEKDDGAKSKAVVKPPVYDPKADYALTKELVESLGQDGYIMVTWANEHYLDFALTWVANLKRSGVTGYIVGAMDDDMLKSLVERGIHTWRMNTGITKKDLGWGSPNFHKMGRSKINLIKTFLEISSLTVVISDIDTAWVRNPIPFFNRYPEADILTSTDQLGPTVKTEDLERWPDAGSAFNIGIMLFKPNSKKFVEDWIKKLEDPNMWDQSAFNDLVRRYEKSNEKGLWKGYTGNLTVGILPASQFASGHVFFVQRKFEEYGLKPYVAHATFQYSGTPGKRHRFREFMLFEDPPEYYDHPKGFISIKVDIPQELLAAADGSHSKDEMTIPKLKTHFDLVNHQLRYIRAGIALATLTGRVLIMPPIMCELDKYWAPLHHGNIPGSMFKKPYICPMDHVLDIEGGWFPNKTEDHWGPQVEWREYSFLQNPRMTPAVNNSRIGVEICDQPDSSCADGSAPALPKDGIIRLVSGLDSAKLQTALGNTGGFKILDVTNIVKMWPPLNENGGWFVEPRQHQRFMHRLKHMTSVACCLQSQPGWVWYDFLWDIPHRDRHNRQYESWQVKPGDQEIKARALLAAASHRRLLGAQTLVKMPEFLRLMQSAAMYSLP